MNDELQDKIDTWESKPSSDLCATTNHLVRRLIEEVRWLKSDGYKGFINKKLNEANMKVLNLSAALDRAKQELEYECKIIKPIIKQQGHLGEYETNQGVFRNYAQEALTAIAKIEEG